jgi:hypothetical protein
MTQPPRVIAITGASSGLGAGLANSYAAPGMTLWLTGRDPTRLEATASSCRNAGATVHTACLDVSDAKPLESWLLDADDAAPVGLVIACFYPASSPANPATLPSSPPSPACAACPIPPATAPARPGCAPMARACAPSSAAAASP